MFEFFKQKLLIFFIILLFMQNLFIKSFPYSSYSYYDINTGKNLTLQEDEEILFILDYSNSMNGRMGYTSKLILIIDLIRKILNKTDNNVKIGLRIFGFSGNSYIAQNLESLYEKEICSSSELIAPVKSNNKDYILNSLGRYASRGASPIGFSLRSAIKNDFSLSAKTKHIILITDGIETCGDNPCKFIREIMRKRNDIIIDVIGITIQENDYSELKCISDYGNGNYYQINNIEDFNKIFSTIKIVSPHEEPAGRPLAGGAEKSMQNIIYKNYLFEFKN